MLVKTETCPLNLSSSYYLQLSPPLFLCRSHLPLHQRSSPPSMLPCQSSVKDLRHWPRQSARSSSAAPRTQPSSRDPLEISRQSLSHLLENDDAGRKSERRRNVLLSSIYGIPTTKARPTTAMRIIGFFSRLSGETVHLESVFAHPAALPNSSFAFSMRTGSTHTRLSLHRTPSS